MQSRTAILLILLAMVVPGTAQQDPNAPPPHQFPTPDPNASVRLPNGKLQIDEILKSDRDRSLQDVKQLIETAQALQNDLEQKNSQQVLNLNDIHRTEEIEKLAKRIRSRIRHT